MTADLLSIGGFPITRSETAAAHATGFAAPHSQFHVTFGAPLQRVIGSGRRELFWPDESTKARRLGDDCIGKRAIVRMVTSSGQSSVAVRVARYEYVARWWSGRAATATSGQ